ncbi:MAG: winged helix-turn-helix transcriptional regulator [Spirochaetia bacterium]|nr:winged helix-turn-helix transcriptional regulator [Spirochaetia bacterium]
MLRSAVKRTARKRNGARDLPGKRDLRRAWLSCLALNLRRTARIVSAFYEESVRPSGLRATQFSILATIEVNPDASIAQIAAWVDADRTTLQRSINVLKRKAWVTVEKAKAGNVRSLRLTAAGRRKLHAAYTLWEAAQSEMQNLVGHTAARTLLRELSRIRASAGGHAVASRDN